MPSSGPEEVDICILGAGPHGLAAAVHLQRAEPGIRLAAVDPAGAWMAGWHEQFARAEIEALRSPIVHHLTPDPYELSEFVSRRGLPRSGLPYDPPTTAAFGSFCAGLIDQVGLDQPVAERAEEVRLHRGGVAVEVGGEEILAEHLVVATNPHRRSIPEWVWPLLGDQPGLFTFGTDVDLRDRTDLAGRRVLVVGGGLTAAHLVCGAAARGAVVQVLARRPIEVRDFDTEPGWLGPRHLADFAADGDPESRLRTAREARGGGTIPGWMRARLDQLIDDDRLHQYEGCGVRAADVASEGCCVLALDDGRTVEVDEVWLATGSTPDLGVARCLGDLVADVELIDGIPVTDDNLRIGPFPIHVMGRLATLTLGPAAGNLWGAQRAANRIVRAVTGIDLEHGSVVPAQRPVQRHRR